MKYSVVILAGGNSSRMGKGKKKELFYLPSENFPEQKQSTVLSCATENFLLNALETPENKLLNIVYVCPDDDATTEKIRNSITGAPHISRLLEKNGTKTDFVTGGKTRQESVLNALEFLNESKTRPDFVAIHDGARPFASKALIKRCLNTAFEKGSGAPVIPVVDTIKILDEKENSIKTHLQRENLGAIQTPQVFSFSEIYSAHKNAFSQNISVTDDTQIWSEFSGKEMFYCEGDIENKKITYLQDLDMENKKTGKNEAQNLTKGKGGTENCSKESDLAKIRIGSGYDLHALVPGRKLFLGGIEIASEFGEDGHSDGDVLLHAVCDALLGAASIGDIGEFFPPNDPKWKDADSKFLLKECWALVRKKGYSLVNLDCVINIERPKLLPYRKKICDSIARLLEVEESMVFVKAKTGEKLGDIGQGRAVQVWANCLLQI